MRCPRRLFWVLALLESLCISKAWAQSASVRGVVVDAQSGQTLAGVTISLKGSDDFVHGTITDANGFFLLSHLTADLYTLRITYVGYDPYSQLLNLRNSDMERLNISLRSTFSNAGQVTIQAERQAATLQAATGMTTIRPGDLQQVPMGSASKDLASFLISMPGVMAPSDRGGQLYIRGGTPTQNQVLVDGIPLYQPFHMVSGYSAFPEDIVTQADIYAGGFGARYGGRIASVIDITTRNGNKQNFSGAVNLDPMLAGLRLEGPLWRQKVSFLVSARMSLLKRFAPPRWANAMPFQFGDRFGKLHAFLSPTTSFSLLGIQTSDQGDLEGRGAEDRQISWKNEVLGARFLHLPPEFPALVEISLSSSRFQSAFGSPIQPKRFGDVQGFRGAFTFDYLFPQIEVRFGMFVRTYRFGYALNQVKEKQNFTGEGGIFADTQIQLGPYFRLEPGLRFHTFPSQGQNEWEPRLRGAWFPQGRTKPQQLSFAFGRYHQQIIGVNDVQDIGEVFVVWQPTKSIVPTATHFLLSWQHTPVKSLFLKLESFYKLLAGLTTPLGNEGLVVASGTAWGADLQSELRLKTMRLNGNYSFSKVTYQVGLPPASLSFHPSHDRRHQVNLMASFHKGRWRWTSRWQFGSGLPFTPVYGLYQALTVTGDPLQDQTQAGTLQPYFAAPFSARLPAYHRLDTALHYTWTVKNFQAMLFASVQNVYNHKNLFYYDLSQFERVDQLGIWPSFGLRVEVN